MARKASPLQTALPGVPAPEVSKTAKAAYVKAQRQTRRHHCHWPGCTVQVPPAMWGCKAHWFRLPRDIRRRIWNTFRPGQERDMAPDSKYMYAARDAQEWIRVHGGAR